MLQFLQLFRPCLHLQFQKVLKVFQHSTNAVIGCNNFVSWIFYNMFDFARNVFCKSGKTFFSG